jgi:MYXO-CTERM domain-containing protein
MKMFRVLAVALVFGGIAAMPLTAGTIVSDNISVLFNGLSIATSDSVTGLTGVSTSADGWYVNFDVNTNINPDLTFDAPLMLEIANPTLVCVAPDGCSYGALEVDATFDLDTDSAFDSLLPYTFSGNASGLWADAWYNNSVDAGQQALFQPPYNFSSTGDFGTGGDSPVTSFSLSLTINAAAGAVLNGLNLAVGENASNPSPTPEIGSGLLVATALAGAFAVRIVSRRRRGSDLRLD